MNPARRKKQEEFDEAEYDSDLLELKRRMAEAGVTIRIPKRNAKWIEREPIDFGESVSDMVIRLRGKEP